MRYLLHATATLLLLCGWASAECPSVYDVPIMYSESRFMCAQYWTGKGDELPIRACNDCKYNGEYIPDGHDGDASECCFAPMGSIIVKAGCVLYNYEHSNFQGDYQEHRGPLLLSNNNWGTGSGQDDGCAKGPTSWQCRCQQKPVDCEPTDSLAPVAVCNNEDNSEPIKCKYTKTIGTEYSNSINESMSIDAEIKYELEFQFFGRFSESIGYSLDTGYDWNSVSSATKSEQVTIEVETEVKPHSTLVIEQATGICGQSNVKTDYFKVSQKNAQGEIVSVGYIY